MKDGRWDDFRTCIIGPKQYLTDKKTDVAHYDAQILYEEIRSWFESQSSDPARGKYKVAILNAAIEQQRRGYTPRVDKQVTDFWKGYWRIASTEFPELTMPEPGNKPAGAAWIELRPRSLGASRRLLHKLNDGFVDLQLDGAAREFEILKLKNQALLGDDLELVPTGRSASFRITVQSIDYHGEAEAQIHLVRAGLRAAFRLATLARVVQSL